MLATNPSPGLSQFTINLLHNSDSMRGCTPTGRSMSPKSADENISSATTTSSPSSTPISMNNNNDVSDKDKLMSVNDSSDPKPENVFESISLLASQGNVWNNNNNNNNDQQPFIDAAALYAMAQPMNGQMRDPELLQQLLKQHALLQRSFQSNNNSMSLQMRQRVAAQQLIGSVASSSTNLSQQPQSQQSQQQSMQQQKMKHEVKNETGQSPDKKRGYPYTFQYCVLCQKNVHSSKLPCHIRQCHVGKPMFQCPACDFTSTYSKNNVKSHMVSLHGITGDPISYMDDYAEQVEEFMKKCFPNVRGRARPFPGRTSNNNNNNNNNNSYSNISNRDYGRHISSSSHKTRQRPSVSVSTTSNPSPKSVSEQSSLLSSTTSSLLLPTFPLFNALQNGSNLDISSLDKPFAEIKEEIVEFPLTLSKDEEKPSSAATTAKFNKKQEKKQTDVTCHYFEDNDQAIYTSFVHRFVRDSDIKGTVFETFTDSSDLIDRIDLSQVTMYCENNNNRLLNAKQIETVANIRQQLPKKDFEIMYALYKCDTSLLSLTQIRLIKIIAPSEVDARRFKQFCEANSVNNLSEEEKFVIELSTIEQLFTRLKVMEITHAYPDILYGLQQEISAYSQGTCTLRQDSLLAMILQCSTIYANFLCGDFGAQLIHGIRIEEAIRVCQHRLPNGVSVGKNIAEMLPIHGMSDSVSKKLEFYKDICQYSFSSLGNRVEKLSDSILQLEAEKASLGIEAHSQATGMVVEEARLRENLCAAQKQMNDALHFYAEPSIASHDGPNPEQFFKTVTQLLSLLASHL